MACPFNLKDYFHKNLKNEKLDVIIFGATGYAGRQTVQNAVDMLKDLHWGIAGRNRDKLNETLETIGLKASTDLSKTPIVITNAQDSDGLTFMAEQCRIIVNCCGPYIETGESLIKACISSGTHYVDMSAEPYFMELMQLKYHDEAKAKDVYIISGCGFQSFLIEIGINFLNKNAKGVFNYVETFTEYRTRNEKIPCPVRSVTAWKSFILALGTCRKIPEVRKELFKKELPNLEPKLNERTFLHQSEVVKGICLSFPIIAARVVERSQYYNYTESNRRPIQFLNYLVFSTYVMAILFLLWYSILGILAQIEFMRNLLIMLPNLFSFGFVSVAGPSEECMTNIIFEITFHAVGWLKCKRSITPENNEPYDNKVKAKVCGSNPAYGVSSVALLCSAITILKEAEKMPESGGVLSPGAAFLNTSIISELDGHGIKFTSDANEKEETK